jgi:hypothetical protein
MAHHLPFSESQGQPFRLQSWQPCFWSSPPFKPLCLSLSLSLSWFQPHGRSTCQRSCSGSSRAEGRSGVGKYLSGLMDCRAQLPHSRLAETFSAGLAGGGGAPCMTTQPNAIGCSPFALSGRSLFPVGRMARGDMRWAWSGNPTILPHSIPLGSGLLLRTTAPEEDYAMIWVDAWIKSCYGHSHSYSSSSQRLALWYFPE